LTQPVCVALRRVGLAA